MKMRHYFWIDWSEIIIQKWNGFINLFTWEKIKTKDIRFFKFDNVFYDLCLTIIENNWLDNILVWWNNEHAVLRNIWTKKFMQNWKTIMASWLSFLWGARFVTIEKYLWSFMSIWKRTVISWKDLYWLLTIWKLSWFKSNTSRKKQKKRYTTASVSLSQKEKNIVNQVIMYSKRIEYLSTNININEEDIKELDLYSDVDTFAAMTIVDSLKQDERTTVEKIKMITKWKTSYKEVINVFNLL